jgi:hypothetical protein
MPDPTKKGKKGKNIKLMGPKDFEEKKPNSTDSLATWMYKDDKRSNWGDIAKAAKKKYGDIDTTNFNPARRGLKPNAPKARKKYGIEMQGKTPIMKQILANQEGLQKMTKTEKGREAVKNMGFTKDVDGAMLMNRNYAAKMGGYSPIKLDTDTGKKSNPNRSDVKNKKEGIDVSSPKIRKMYDKYKSSGGKLSINQAARIGFASPSESKRRMKQANIPGGRGKDGLKDI